MAAMSFKIILRLANEKLRSPSAELQQLYDGHVVSTDNWSNVKQVENTVRRRRCTSVAYF